MLNSYNFFIDPSFILVAAVAVTTVALIVFGGGAALFVWAKFRVSAAVKLDQLSALSKRSALKKSSDASDWRDLFGRTIAGAAKANSYCGQISPIRSVRRLF